MGATRVVFLLAGATGLGLLLVFRDPLIAMAEDHEQMAAWVQAIMSVLAIMFAAGLGHRDRLQRLTDNMESLYGLMKVGSDLISNGQSALKNATREHDCPLVHFELDRFERVDKLLESVAPMDLGSTTAPTIIMEMRSCIKRMKSVIDDEFTKGVPVKKESLSKADGIAEVAARQTDIVKAWMNSRALRARLWFLP